MRFHFIEFRIVMQDQAIVLRRQLDRRVQSGESGVARQLLAESPELAQDSDLALELLYCEFATLESLGRPATIESLCGDNEEWQRELSRVVEVHEALSDTSLSIKPDSEDTSIAHSSTSWLNDDLTTCGPYEIKSRLGQGGMGTVFRARHQTLNRDVALKVLNSVLAGPAERARLRVESELAARLSHPNIVAIYDVGESQDGPYLAMELVDGESLAQRLARQEINSRNAAELIETMASAVQYAHEQGVIHRDLKPSNVLLRDDATPLIADFGLAKTIAKASDDKQLTVTGEIIGTPAYMSPELALGQSQEAGPATDVYSLGVILYEMLTGRPPFRGDSPLDTLAQIRNEPPVAARQVVATVPRDLETICSKCLAKQPSERYATAGELAEELRRFLDGKPIIAQPQSHIVHFVRWCQRRPTQATLLAVCILFPMILAVGAWIFAWQQSKLRAAADASNQKAQTAALEKSEVTQFLLNNVLSNKGGDPDARWKEIDSQVTQRLEQLARSPHARKSHIWVAVTKLYVDYSVPDERLRDMGEKTLELLTSEKGANDRETSAFRFVLGNVYKNLGEYEKAIDQFEIARTSFETLHGVSSEGYLEACRMIASVDALTGDTTPGVQLDSQALASKTSVALVSRLEQLEVRKDEIVPAKLVAQVRDLLSELESQDIRSDAWIRRGKNLLAGALRRNGDYAEAEAMYVENIKELTETYGPAHAARLMMMNNLGWTYAEQGFLDKAAEIAKQVFETRKENYGLDKLNTLNALNNLGTCYRHMGDYDRAYDAHNQAATHAASLFGAESPTAIWYATCRADALMQLARVDEAIDDLKSTLSLATEKLGRDHQRTNRARAGLAQAYAAKMDYKQAIELTTTSIGSLRKSAKGVTPLIRTKQINLAANYRLAGRYNDAIKLLDESQETIEKLKASHPLRIKWNFEMGGSNLKSGEHKLAIHCLESVTTNETRSIPNDAYARMSEFLLGIAFLGNGEADRGEEQLSASYQSLLLSHESYPPLRRLRFARMIHDYSAEIEQRGLPVSRWQELQRQFADFKK